MSSGSPMRPIIAFAAKASSVPCQLPAPRPPFVMSVRTNPGATAFTVMLWGQALMRSVWSKSRLGRGIEGVKDPAHVAPIDGKEYSDHRRGANTQHARSETKTRNLVTVRDDHNIAKLAKTARSSNF